MIGKYEIEVYNNRVHYYLTVKRNITVIQGNSATGKTELIRLISENNMNGVSSGITVKCRARCRVLDTEDWDVRLAAMKGSIVFIDESAGFLKTKKFAEMLHGSDNYYVIVTRDDLSQLPYSVDEIYGLRNVNDSAKYKTYKKVYNEMFKLYNFDNSERFVPDIVVTEDSNSGFECMDCIYPGKCVAAGGKSRIYKKIRAIKENKILIIVDGAAFGSEISKVYKYIIGCKETCVLYAPESFEYLIIKSGIISAPESITENTFEYADSREYLSWEEFYTAYLIRETENTVYQYSKAKLREPYKTVGSLRRVVGVIPEQIRP